MKHMTTTTLPLSGQFVATYVSGNKIFSATMRWSNGDLQAYDGFSDQWVSSSLHGYSMKFFRSASAIYTLI